MERDPNRQAMDDARAMTQSAHDSVVQATKQQARLDVMRERNREMRERIRKSAEPPLPGRES